MPGSDLFDDYDKLKEAVDKKLGRLSEDLLELTQGKYERYNGLINKPAALCLAYQEMFGVSLNEELGNPQKLGENLGVDFDYIREVTDSNEYTQFYVVGEIKNPDLILGDGWKLFKCTLIHKEDEIELALWNEDAEWADKEVQEGDKILIEDAYGKKYKGDYQVNASKKSNIKLIDD